MAQTLNLLLHEVTDEPKSTGFVRTSALPFKHNKKLFNQYLDILTSTGNSIILPNEYENNVGKINITLSFDDGGISNMYSADVIENHGYKGLFFVITDYINRKGFLTERDINDLQGRGHIIGSHSHTHPNVFTSLPYHSMLDQWTKSKHILEKIVGQSIIYCSVPGGDVSTNTYDSAGKAGFTNIFDSEPKLEIRNISGTLVHGRFCLKNTNSAAQLKEWVQGNGLTRYAFTWNTKKSLKKWFYPIYKLKRKLDKHDA